MIYVSKFPTIFTRFGIKSLKITSATFRIKYTMMILIDNLYRVNAVFIEPMLNTCNLSIHCMKWYLLYIYRTDSRFFFISSVNLG